MVTDRQVTAVLITLFFFAFLVVVIGWLIVASIIDRKREQERTRQMVNVAGLLGWQFAEVFSLRPEHAFHKIISAFGYQDIDFGNRPTFSSKYLLRGPDEQGIRNLFTDALLGFYEMNEGTSTDGGGSQLFIFRQNSRPSPHETQAFLNWGLQLQRLCGNRW